jgi:hypothetical protein
MKALIAQTQTQPQPEPSPLTPPQFYGGLGVFLTLMTAGLTIFAKTFPNYLDRFFKLREEEKKARIEADKHERDSDLKREETTHGTLNEFTRTLLANQLQSSKQFQEEVASIMQIQNQQIGIILRQLEESSRNQQRFFDLGSQILAGQAEIKLEIERNRKVYQQKTRFSEPAQTPQTPQAPQLPNIPS